MKNLFKVSSFWGRCCLFFLLLPLSGCQKPQVSKLKQENLGPRFPTDDLNRAVELANPAQRVVVIGPGAIETIFALGAGAKLVGRDSYADFPAEAKKIAIAGDYSGPSVEKCIALRPDLVLVQGETWDKARVEQWQTQIGAPVAALVATDVNGVRKGIKKIGKWLGEAKKADGLAANIRPQAFYGQHSAFIEVGRSPLWTAGQNTLVSDVASHGGFKNVAKVRGYQAFNLESLLALQPETYLVPSKSSRAVVLRQLRASPTLSKLKCVKRGHVVVIHPDLLLRPGPRLMNGMALLGTEASRLTDAKAGKRG
ncbi:MAG TPA: helical backbone metal receptor [Abditibacterium sp.]